MKNLTQAQVNILLNQALNKVYEAPIAAFESTTLLPRGTNGVSAGAESFSWWEMSGFGVAKFVDRYAKDLPPVGMAMKQKFAGVGIAGDSYSFSYFDLLNAQYEGIPLNTRLGVIQRNAILMKQDSNALEGDSEHGFTGFINNPNVPVVAIPNGDWKNSSTTGDDIVDDFQAIIDAVKDATRNSEKPDSIAIASKQFAKLNNKRIDNSGESPRILQYLKDTFPQIKNWYSADCLNGVGVGGKDRVVLYTKAEDAVMHVVPLEFTLLPEQWAGLAATVNGVAKDAGTIFFRPLSAAYADV